MHRLGLDTLDFRKKIRVKTELQNRARLGRSRELRFYHFVGEIAERTGPIDSDEEIRPATPRSILKGGLIDRISAAPDCFNRSGDRISPSDIGLDMNNFKTPVSVR
jgi:hypothetical protein